jgi:serine protease Do
MVMQKDRKTLVWALSALLMVGSLAGGLLVAQSGRTAPASAPAVSTQAPELVGPMVPAGGFAPIVKKAGPSVVSIASTMVSKTSGNDSDSLSQLFPGFPGFGFPDSPQFRSPQGPHKQQAAGSGVIITSDGYILTNSHVVDGATKVRVKLADKREFDARVIGTDTRSDIAVVKVEATGLPAVTLGDSSKVEVGDLALAIGNPFDLGQTVTMGIVSALGRTGLGIEDYENFIQTDAAVNPGNSGGALVNTRGELIGINTAILSESGGNQGIGFAIPSNMARSLMNEIKDHGKVTRGFLGVGIQEVTPELASNFGAKDSKGALVSEVKANSPAANAGILRGDIIREVNGDAVNDTAALKFKVAEMAPGSNLSLKVLRNGVEKNLSVKVGTLEEDAVASKAGPSSDSNTGGKLGVAIQDLTPQIARSLRLPASASGVVVTQVQPESPAADAGIQQGDIVEEVNHQAVKSTGDFRGALNGSSKSVLLLINRNGDVLYKVVNREG